MRIVSLNCSNTEIVCALGCAKHLVGVDSDSDYPASVVSRLPRVGRDLEIDIEKVQALRPDVVLASLTVPGHEKIVAALERAGLDYLAPEPVSLEDVYRDIRAIGGKLDAETQAQRVVGAMRERIKPDRDHHGPGPSIVVQWWPKPVIAPGQLSWVNDLLQAAGARNPLAGRPVKSLPITDDEVAELDPDAMVIAWCGVAPAKYRADVIYRKAAWQDLRAVQRRQVYPVPEAYLGRPGPRLVQGCHALSAIAARLRATR